MIAIHLSNMHPCTHCSNQHSERRSSNHSLQMSSLNGLQDCISPVGTPLSSVSDYKHHMLSSSTNGALYDRLSEYRKESVSSNYDKRTGSVSSDGHVDMVDHTDQGIPVQKVNQRGVTVAMYASDGRIQDSVLIHNSTADNGASARDTRRQIFSSTGKLASAHSLSPTAHQPRIVPHLPSSSLRQLPTIQQYGNQQHLLCPPTIRSMTGSTPAVSVTLW